MRKKRNRRKNSSQTLAANRKARRERMEQNQEFYDCIRDIVYHPIVLKMKKYYQHCETDCYQHCLSVAYYNYRICKALNLDYRSAARGGMVHDLFLYDWRDHTERTGDHLHALTHPRAAYLMAKKYFSVNPIEKEVILKHMWPLTIVPPRHWETYVICLTDKYCGSLEIAEYYSGRLVKYAYGRMVARLVRKLSHRFPEIQRVIFEIAAEERSAKSPVKSHQPCE